MNLNGEPRSSKATEKPKRAGMWTQEEHNKMVTYVLVHREEIIENATFNISNKTKRNRVRFFKEMSNFIGTKNEVQCKSRFQKKELVMLEAINMPKKLLKLYIESRANRRVGSEINSQENEKKQSTTTNDIAFDEQSIRSFGSMNPDGMMEEVAGEFHFEFMSPMRDDPSREQFHNFLSIVPNPIDHQDREYMSFHHLSALNISVFGVGQMDLLSRESSANHILSN